MMKITKKIKNWYMSLVSKMTGDEYGVDEQAENESVRINLQAGDQVLSIRMKLKEQEMYRKAARSLTELYNKYRESYSAVPEIQLLAFIALKEKIANQK